MKNFDFSLCAKYFQYGSVLVDIPSKSLQVLAFKGKNMTFTVNVLLTRILHCETGPGYD